MMRRRNLLKYLVAVPLALSLNTLTESAATEALQTGPDASLDGLRLFPADNEWNQDISVAPLDPNSAALIASIGLDRGLHPDFGTVYDGAPNGIPYVVVDSSQAKVPVSFEYADESDKDDGEDSAGTSTRRPATVGR